MSKRSVQIMLLILAVLAGAGIWWTLSGSSNDPDAFNWNMDVRQGYQQAAETLQVKTPWEYEALKAAEATLEAAQAAIPDDAVRPARGGVYVIGADYYWNESAWKALDAASAALEKAKAAVALKAPKAYEAYEAYYAALMALEKSKLVFGAAQEFDSASNTALITSDESDEAVMAKAVYKAKAVYHAADTSYGLLTGLEGPLAASMVNMDELKASYETLHAAYFALDAAKEAYVAHRADKPAGSRNNSGPDFTGLNIWLAYGIAQKSYLAATKAYLENLPKKAQEEYEVESIAEN